MIKLSRVKKLDGIRSFSTQARESCPFSKDVQVCEGCYATTGNYRFKNVKEPRMQNNQEWRKPTWVKDMIQLLDSDRYFRWFDSGDVQTVSQAIKILEVMKNTPWVKHWLPTRSYKSNAIKAIFEEMNQLQNVVVRFSSDNYNQDTTPTDTEFKSIVIGDEVNATGFLCEAYKNKDKNCNGCRSCWSKDIKEINYLIHGIIALSKYSKLKDGE